jgi:topoisomerase-4 subunit A
MVTRFQVLGVTRDKEYDLTKGTKGSKVMYFTANPNGEAEIITVFLTQGAKARVKVFDFDFATIEIKGRGAQGNILTKYPVRKIQLKMEGVSTLGGLNIYYDAVIGRLNTDQRGRLIGNFLGEDRILVCYKSGDYELTTFELTNRFEAGDVLLIEKFNPQNVISAVYFDGGSKTYFVKRFQVETTTINKKFNFITEHKQSYLKLVSTEKQPQIAAILVKGKEEEHMEYDLDMLIDVKGWKAIGNKLSNYPIKDLTLLQSKVEVEPESTENDEASEDADGSDQLEIGSSIDLTVKNEDEDQLGLF